MDDVLDQLLQIIGATIGESTFGEKTKLLHRGSAPERRRESARCAAVDVVAEVVAGAAPDGWKNYPGGRSLRLADGATTRFVTQIRNCADASCNPNCLLFALIHCIIYAEINNDLG
jgi:hypothetical protein